MATKKILLQMTEDIKDEIDLNESKSRYDIEVLDKGFIISAPGRKTTYVTINDKYCFDVTRDLVKPGDRELTYSVGPYNFRNLLKTIVESLLAEYKRPASKIPLKQRKNRNEDYIPPALTKWLQSKVEQALNHRIHEQWARLIKLIPPQQDAIARAVFRASLSYSDLFNDPSLNNHPYLIKDIIKYFSAAAMVSRAPEIHIRMNNEMIEKYGGTQDSVGHIKAYNMFYVNPNPSPGYISIDRQYAESQQYKFDSAVISIDQYFELMENWRSLYSYNLKPYRALDITLDHASNVSSRLLVKNLPHIRLERPIYDRLELTTLLCAYGVFTSHGLIDDNYVNDDERNIEAAKLHNAALFKHATHKQIMTFLERVGNHLVHAPFSHRKMTQIETALRFVYDLPEVHHGNIVGLADKAIEYHRDIEARAAAERKLLSDPETPNKLPPIPLPEAEGVRFLDTIKSLYDESDLMHHCVYTYSRSTVRGNSFIFHVERDGDMATIELNQDGRIVQAQGIHNKQYSFVNRSKKNAAITYGQRILRAWAKNFYEIQPDDDENDDQNEGFYNYGFGERYEEDDNDLAYLNALNPEDFGI